MPYICKLIINTICIQINNLFANIYKLINICPKWDKMLVNIIWMGL